MGKNLNSSQVSLCFLEKHIFFRSGIEIDIQTVAKKKYKKGLSKSTINCNNNSISFTYI